MKAIVLAAGLGTRLRPLTDAVPKPLLPIAGRPLIVWNLLLIREQGVGEVVVNLHYCGRLIEQVLGDGRQWGLRIAYSREPCLLGTGGGVRCAQALCGEDPVLVVNGDTFVEFDLQELLAFHRNRNGLATMVVRDDPEPERWGVIEMDKDRRILSINGRGRNGRGRSVMAARGTVAMDQPVRRSMFAGVQLVTRSFLDVIPPAKESSIIDAYVHWLEKDVPIHGYVASGYWNDIGTPARYVQTQLDAEAGRIPFLERLNK